MLKRLQSNTTQWHCYVCGERTEKWWWLSVTREKWWWRSVTCRDRLTVMDAPPSSTGQVRLLRLQTELLGCCGSAVQGLQIWGSVVDGTGGGGSERTERERMAVRDPLRPQLQPGGITFSFAWTLSAGWATAAWYLHTRTQIYDDSRPRCDYALRMSW